MQRGQRSTGRGQYWYKKSLLNNLLKGIKGIINFIQCLINFIVYINEYYNIVTPLKIKCV